MAQPKRKDKSRVVLRKGEVQRANGTYHYCWTDGKGKRHFVYAKLWKNFGIRKQRSKRISPMASKLRQNIPR